MQYPRAPYANSIQYVSNRKTHAMLYAAASRSLVSNVQTSSLVSCAIPANSKYEELANTKCRLLIRNSISRLHSHLRLQLPKFLFFVVLFDSCGCLASNLGGGCLGQRADGHVACLEHFCVELFLLKFCEFVFELVFVDCVVGYAGGYRFGDLFADCVLFAETFPVVICKRGFSDMKRRVVRRT